MLSYAFKLANLEILRSVLAEKQPVRKQVLCHVSLPSESAHTGYKCAMPAGMVRKIRIERELSGLIKLLIFSNHRRYTSPYLRT